MRDLEGGHRKGNMQEFAIYPYDQVQSMGNNVNYETFGKDGGAEHRCPTPT